MNQAKIDKLFKLFENVHQKNTLADFNGAKTSGNGLGLYLSNELCKYLGGKIDIQSKEGKGTKVEVKLPVAVNEQSIELSVSQLDYIEDDIL